MGSGAKSYIKKGFLIYEEMFKYLTIHEEVIHSEFDIYEENFISFFISAKLA
jgi:hypothetical protein